MELLTLPPLPILEVLRRLNARSLVALQQTNSYFSRKEPGSRLPLLEHVAREKVLALAGGDPAQAQRFRHRSWSERLHLEEATGAGFDREFSEAGGFRFQFSEGGDAVRSVRLTGMGPKLLVSDTSTREQGVLRWRLRVKGNTAVEFGVIPADLPPSHTALHKCMSAPDTPHQRAMGFCSQITAGSLLPLKAPVMRGTVLDVVARRGHLEVVLSYPEDAKEISWQNGQPVQRPYRGPAQLRFEQDFCPDFDVRLAVTSWAKAHFEVLHTGYSVDPEWAVESAAAEQAAAEYEVAEAAAAAMALPEELLAGAAEPAAEPGMAAELAAPLLHHAPPPGVAAEYHGQQAVAAAAAPRQLLDEVQALRLEQHAATALHAHQLQQMVAGAVHAAAQDAAATSAAAPAADAQQLAASPLAEPASAAAADDLALLRELQAAPADLLAGVQAAALDLEGPGAQLAAASLPDAAPAAVAGATVGLTAPLALCHATSTDLSEDGHLPGPSHT